MLIHGSDYARALQDALASAREASVAIAFWGTGAAASLFKNWQGERLNIICNLAHGGTNPAAIEELQKLTGAEVRQLSDLHAKVVVTDAQVVVGSANASANGLGFESGELTGWREAGVVSCDEQIRADAETWFAQQWQAAKEITPADLAAAEARWKARRKVRIQPATGSKLLEQTSESQRDSCYYLVVYRQSLSQQARERLKWQQTTLSERAGIDKPSKLDVYEGWESAHREILSDRNAVLVPVYHGSRGKIVVHDAQRPLPDLAETYTDDDQKEVGLCFTAVVQDKTTVQFVAASESEREWVTALRPWLEQQRQEGRGAQIAPISDFLAWREADKQ